MQFWLLTLITQLRKIISERWLLLAVHTSGASQSFASHLLTFLVAQLQFLREWKLSDRRLYEVFERRLLIWGNSKERNRRYTTTHFKNMRSFCAILYKIWTNFILSNTEPLLTKMFEAIGIVFLQVGRLKNYENVVILWKWDKDTKYNGIFILPSWRCGI